LAFSIPSKFAKNVKKQFTPPPPSCFRPTILTSKNLEKKVIKDIIAHWICSRDSFGAMLKMAKPSWHMLSKLGLHGADTIYVEHIWLALSGTMQKKLIKTYIIEIRERENHTNKFILVHSYTKSYIQSP